MASYSQETKDISVDVVVLPGFSEGLSQRGAWFAHSMDADDFIRKFLPHRWHVVRYNIHEPASKVPLSDGEIEHLTNRMTGAYDQYRSELERSELSSRDLRRGGKINALLYLLSIITLRWYWWIFITRGEHSFVNQSNALKMEYARNTRNFLVRFWERGTDDSLKAVLDEIVDLYCRFDDEPLRKYLRLLYHCKEKAEAAREAGDRVRMKAYQRVEQGYRDIIKKLTDKSIVVKTLPTSFWKRIGYFFTRNFKVPEPEVVHPVRDLSQDIRAGLTAKDIAIIPNRILGSNRADGNLYEIYLLATKGGDPICVPAKDDVYFIPEAMARAEAVQSRDLPMEMVLHVGTEAEREALLGFNPQGSVNRSQQRELLKRLQNAALDTTRRDEAIVSYYYREMMSVSQLQFRRMDPLRSRLHSFFPWLFITNAIPMAAALAAVWLFVEPYYGAKTQRSFHGYFSNMLSGADRAYHNIVIRVRKDPALGYINHKIKTNSQGKTYRDIIRDINEFALPLALMDRALLNNLTTETAQLTDYGREANDFTSIPLSFYNAGSDEVKGLAEVVGS